MGVRLARKLVLALTVAMLLVFTVRSWARVRTEIRVANANQREDERLIGYAIRPLVVGMWRTEGQERALQLLREAERQVRRARIRWVSLDQNVAPFAQPLVSRDQLGAVARGQDVTLVHPSVEGNLLATYIPLSSDGSIPGAIEVSESVAVPREDLRRRLPEVLTNTALATLASILVVSALGYVLVIRPMRRLADKARRIGAGDLSGPLPIHQNDEMGELAMEMNQMCDRLREAHAQIETEVLARIKTVEHLRHADRLSTVGKLASGIAHEMGTPLAVVSGRAKMIERGEVTGADSTSSARVIVDQAERMAKIIRQLLDFARRRGPQKAPCDLLEIGRVTLSILGPLAQKKRVDLALETGSSPTRIAADGGQVQQALTNLVVNGIEAMPEGGKVMLRVGCESVRPPADHGGPLGPYACVRVTDEGAGIGPEDVGRVFEPFFTTKDVGEGTGLGLSVAYGIVRDHGGWIAVESKTGCGTQFCMYLPADPEAHAA